MAKFVEIMVPNDNFSLTGPLCGTGLRHNCCSHVSRCLLLRRFGTRFGKRICHRLVFLLVACSGCPHQLTLDVAQCFQQCFRRRSCILVESFFALFELQLQDFSGCVALVNRRPDLAYLRLQHAIALQLHELCERRLRLLARDLPCQNFEQSCGTILA